MSYLARRLTHNRSGASLRISNFYELKLSSKLPSWLADAFNLAAAVLCTLGSGIGGLAILLSGPAMTNIVAGVGCILGTFGGLAWIGAAAIPLYTRNDGQ